MVFTSQDVNFYETLLPSFSNTLPEIFNTIVEESRIQAQEIYLIIVIQSLPDKR